MGSLLGFPAMQPGQVALPSQFSFSFPFPPFSRSVRAVTLWSVHTLCTLHSYALRHSFPEGTKGDAGEDVLQDGALGDGAGHDPLQVHVG